MVHLEMQDVWLDYGRKPVLKGISLEVRPGEMVGLIGPNGSGKSSIIRALSRIVSPRSGRIIINGTDVTTLSRRDLARQIGVVPQIPILPSAFSAFEIVLMGRNPHLNLFQYEGAKEMAIAWEAMKLTGTISLAARRVNELSGGEIQSVLIARALAQGTPAILLDEPTANLDIGRQVEMLDLIKELCKDGTHTVLAALHDLNLACEYCDRLVLVYEGRVYAEGKPEQVIIENNIKEVFGAKDCIYAHPRTGLPVVLLNANSHTERDSTRERP